MSAELGYCFCACALWTACHAHILSEDAAVFKDTVIQVGRVKGCNRWNNMQGVVFTKYKTSSATTEAISHSYLQLNMNAWKNSASAKVNSLLLPIQIGQIIRSTKPNLACWKVLS